MADIKNDAMYMEGIWIGKSMVKNIHVTDYGNLETALEAKETLLEDFRTHFGWSEDDDKWDPDFAKTVGIVTALKEAIAEQESN